MFFAGNETLGGHIERLRQPKEAILTALMTKFDLDIKGSTAVGGTSKDAGILKMVEHPIAFNPNQALFTTAREQGWMVVIERKDVVYGLSKDGNSMY